MTRRKQTTAFALAGAVALASGAYALGAQADDGAATANGRSAGHGYGLGPGRAGGPGMPGPRAGFEDLADRLGVDEAELRRALGDIASERKADFAERLADALNVEPAKVEQALEDAHPDRPHRPRPPEALAAALAKQLGLSTAKVRAALEQRRGRPGHPGELADALGVSEERLREAFHAVFDKVRPRFGNLAKELGVTQARLEAALEELRDDHDDLHDELAQELADRLNLDVAEVEDALETPRWFRRRGP